MRTTAPKSITIQNLDNPSIKWINRKAERLNVHIEDLIVKLIHDQMTTDETELMPYRDLDSLAGTWSKNEADDFFQTIDRFNQVDENLWA